MCSAIICVVVVAHVVDVGIGGGESVLRSSSYPSIPVLSDTVTIGLSPSSD